MWEGTKLCVPLPQSGRKWAEGSVAKGLKTEMEIKTDNWKWSSRFDSPRKCFLAPNCVVETINRMVLRHLDTMLGLLGT